MANESGGAPKSPAEGPRDKGPFAPVPTAAVGRSRRIPLIWAVPIITALIGGWLAWDTFSKRGPTIVVEFDYGNGLTPDQSVLKYKDVPMGTVKKVDISPDLKKVLIT